MTIEIHYNETLAEVALYGGSALIILFVLGMWAYFRAEDRDAAARAEAERRKREDSTAPALDGDENAEHVG